MIVCPNSSRTSSTSVVASLKTRKRLFNLAYFATWERFKAQLQKTPSELFDIGHRNQCTGLRIGLSIIIVVIGSRQRILYTTGTMICKHSEFGFNNYLTVSKSKQLFRKDCDQLD